MIPAAPLDTKVLCNDSHSFVKRWHWHYSRLMLLLSDDCHGNCHIGISCAIRNFIPYQVPLLYIAQSSTLYSGSMLYRTIPRSMMPAFLWPEKYILTNFSQMTRLWQTSIHGVAKTGAEHWVLIYLPFIFTPRPRFILKSVKHRDTHGSFVCFVKECYHWYKGPRYFHPRQLKRELTPIIPLECH